VLHSTQIKRLVRALRAILDIYIGIILVLAQVRTIRIGTQDQVTSQSKRLLVSLRLGCAECTNQM
jgi:hypothetical protein